MQRGVETLDTYLKLLLQVLELRYIASLLFAIRKSCGIRIRCDYIQGQQRKPFIFALSKQVSMPKSLTKMSPFCKSIHPKRKVRKALCECFFFSLSELIKKRKRKKDCRYESSQAPKAAMLPCSLLAVGSSSLACPWNPTVDPPTRHLTQVSIVQRPQKHTRTIFFVHQNPRKKVGGGWIGEG